MRLTESDGWSPSKRFGARTARAIPAVTSRIEWTGWRKREGLRVSELCHDWDGEDHLAGSGLHPLSRGAREHQPRYLS
jgi:hypothetical protein